VTPCRFTVLGRRNSLDFRPELFGNGVSAKTPLHFLATPDFGGIVVSEVVAAKG
jgi:hypothetical protein